MRSHHPPDKKESVGVLESTEPVVESARQVWIDERTVAELANRWVEEEVKIPDWNDQVHWSDGSERTAAATLLLDTWNFCFWPDPGEPKWGIEYQGKELNGYNALAASIKRAIEEGEPLYDPARWVDLTKEDLQRIFRGRGTIPMLEARLESAHQVGERILKGWDGKVLDLIKAAGNSAIALTHLIVKNFPCFDDHTIYDGHVVRFYKRAQILVMDLAGSMPQEPAVEFKDAHQLTAFADYKIPQVLEAYGVLRYDPELQGTLLEQAHIPSGDPREVEIRAGMVWAVEKLRQALERKGRRLAAYQLDWLLWNLGQQTLENQKPYHRTRTLFY